jgi:hypothetical protein
LKLDIAEISRVKKAVLLNANRTSTYPRIKICRGRFTRSRGTPPDFSEWAHFLDATKMAEKVHALVASVQQ